MRFPLLALTLFFIGSCSRNAVLLDYTNAKGEVPQLGNLVFRFNHPLAADSMINEWDSTRYIRFQPDIPGRFRWEQPDQLVFSPAQPLPPATSFTAKITDEILLNPIYDHVSAGSSLKFHTPELRLEDVHATWVPKDDQSRSAIARLDLYFNYPVAPDMLKDKLQLRSGGQVIPFSMYSLSEDSRISVLLGGLQPRDNDMSTSVTIASGIVPKGGSSATEKELTGEVNIPSPFTLVVNDISAEHDGLAGLVNISTSQQVSVADITPLIRIEPAVRYSVETTDEGFALRSENFDASKSYLITLKKGLKGRIGGVLQEQYDNHIAFGELEPSVRFTTAKSVYLSSQGNRMLEMKITNVPKIKVVISKIFENNLLASRYYGYEPKETSRSNNEEEVGYYDEGGNISAGDVLYEEEIDTRSLPKSGNSRLFHFNVDDRLPDLKGVYHIRVRSAQNYWVSDSRFIALSDLGLIAREGKDKLFVFVNSIKSAESVSGVNIIAYGKNNQVLAMGATNENGAAELAYTRREFAGFRPAMVIAKTENDFNYLPFNDTRVNMSRFETGGKQMNSTALDAFIYPERDIYRPGERVNFSVIVRDMNWRSPGMLPLKFKFLMPNGKEWRTFRKTLNEQGSVEGQVEISSAAVTGSYTLEVYSSNDILLGSRNFSIEEFVPDRIKVNVALDKPSLEAGSRSVLSINAVNFFGPPAAGRNYETEIQLKAKDFRSKKFASYDFNIQNQGLSLDKVVREGKLNEQGNAAEMYEVPLMFKNTGVLKADFYTTVFDETGRPVSRMISADVFTQETFLGLARDGYWYYPLNQPVKFGIIALDRNEKVLNGIKTDVTVIKHEYRTVLSKAGSYFRYESQEDDKVISRQTITTGGENSSYAFVPRSPGNYELRISLPGATGYVSRKFYSYGSWGGDNQSFEVNTEGNIDIETDKSIYHAGDKAKILFKSPFNGKMLVTVEMDKVLSYQYVTVEKRTATIALPIGPEHLPNIFVTATLIKPHGISDIPLTVAHGFQNLKVEDEKRKNKVTIAAATTSRSRTKQQVIVRAEPGSYVTLAAVDNGVLQVSDFRTPDPYNYFYSSRALQVSAYDLYPYLFPEIRGRLSSTGGDGEMSMQKRVNPMPSKRVQIVSYWSGMVKTNGSGQAKIDLDIPAFSGQIRLMAVAYKDQSFGSAESTITVADPFVISTALPRFLSPGDTLSVPVTITNTTARNAGAVTTIRVKGPLTAIGAPSQNATLLPNSEARVMFRVAAKAALDTGRISVEVKAGSETFTQDIPIGVRPASPLLRITDAGSVEGGSTGRIQTGTDDLMTASVKQRLVVSRSPLLGAADQIRYLVQYPYGCTEQIISSAFPQLYYGDMAGQLSGIRQGSYNANQHVLEAIRKISLRQLYNGAVTLWENEGTEQWWTTIYAAHFLLEARKAGFEVDDALINTMLTYINNRLRNKTTIIYHYNRDQKKKIAPKEVAYGLYVLALASKPNIPAMNYYKANTAVLSLDSKYLLGAAYAVAGDKKKFAELLPVAFQGEVSVPETGGSFYSPIRDEAIALNALIDVDPANAQIPLMARHVTEQLKQRNWYSTQECAFSFLALGKLSKSAASSAVTAEIRQGGKKQVFDGKDITYVPAAGENNAVEIVTKGKGRLYYYFEKEGISKSGNYREEDKFIRVRRQFFDRYGQKLSGNEFKVNDLVIVQLTLDRTFSTDVNNIVVTDMLPAGFEIENPRTREIPGMEWIRDADSPLQLDVRDDRINLFVDLTRNKQVYYYAVRAVTPGKFKIGPVAADAMYNGEYHSYHGGGTVNIND